MKIYLFSFMGILIFINLISASSYIDNSKLQISEVILNDSGLFYSNTKAFSRTADVVVCRGTSAADDLKKLFECDVVCLSTDNDCSDEFLNAINSLSNGQNLIIIPGDYYFSSYINSSYWYFTSLPINKSNINIWGYGAKLHFDFPYNNTQRYSAIYVFNSNNVLIEGIEIIGDNDCNDSNYCAGLHINDVIDSDFNYIKTNNVKGFGVKIDSWLSGTRNVKLQNSLINATGIRDAIGGGPLLNPVAAFEDVSLLFNTVYITNINGNHKNAVDLVGCLRCKVNNNLLYGFSTYGSEHLTIDSEMSNNVILPNSWHNDARLWINHDNTSGIKIINNYISGGGIRVKGNNHQVFENMIVNNPENNIFYGNNNEIINNKFSMLNIGNRVLDIYGNNNLVNNNKINGGQKGIYNTGSFNTFSENYVTNISNYSSYSISIQDENGVSNSYKNNYIFINSFDSTRSAIFFTNTSNSTISSNNIYNNDFNVDYLIKLTSNSSNNIIGVNYFFGNISSNRYGFSTGANDYLNLVSSFKYITQLPKCDLDSIFDNQFLINITDGKLQNCYCYLGKYYCNYLSYDSYDFINNNSFTNIIPNFNLNYSIGNLSNQFVSVFSKYLNVSGQLFLSGTGTLLNNNGGATATTSYCLNDCRAILRYNGTAGTSAVELIGGATKHLRLIANNALGLFIDASDSNSVTLPNLAGSGSVLVCVNSVGKLYRGNATGCP